MAPSTSRSTLLITLLALVSLVGYTLRSNITIAQEYMAPELGLTMNDMGTITASGFQLAYALFQIPAGFLGDRFGARLVLGLAITGWAIASLASGLVPAVAGSAFLTLFSARVLLGMSQAATYPVGSMAVAQSIPVERRTTANAIYIAAAMLGSALAPLTLAPLMVQAGWRAVFIASGVIGLSTALIWFLFAPVAPARRAATESFAAQLRGTVALLKNRDLMLLSTSYFLHSAVLFVFIFWFFRYLTEGRGFSVLASGVWGSVPYFVAFALGPLGGLITDRLSRRFAPGVARRRVAMTCILLSAALVAIGANLPSPYLAIAALGLSVGMINAAEGPFWTTATSLGRHNPGAAGGVLNLMGNLGGVVSIWAVPRMKDAWGWTTMLGFWAVIGVMAALVWLLVRVDQEETTAKA